MSGYDDADVTDFMREEIVRLNREIERLTIENAKLREKPKTDYYSGVGPSSSGEI